MDIDKIEVPANGVETATITGVPVGSLVEVHYNGKLIHQEGFMVDDTLVLTFGLAGIYTVTITDSSPSDRENGIFEVTAI